MICVVGATGVLGGMITHQLLEQGKDVRILVRENSPAAEMAKQGMATDPGSLVGAGAQLVYGDLKDPASLGPALAGVDTVISTANSVLRGGDDNLESVDLQGTTNLINAAQDAGVGHFIYLSVLGASPDSPLRLAQIKSICEDRIKASGMDYTFFQPSYFMQIWVGAVIGPPLQAGQPITIVGDGDRKRPFVWMQDVAAYAVASVDNPRAANQTEVIAGADSYSWNEVAEAVGKVLGQELPVQHVGFDDPIPLLAPNIAELFRGMEMAPDQFIDMSDTSAKYGIEPTPLNTAMQYMFGH